MANFYITPENISGDTAYITGEEAKHISRVLRLKAGDKAVLCDGTGYFYDAVFKEFTKETVTAKITKKRPADTEPEVKITVYQCIPKNPKLETIVQKLTEIGVCRIVPVSSARCVAKIEKEEKLSRLQKIAREAAKQSKRGVVPAVCGVLSFKEAAKEAAKADVSVIPYEEECTLSLKQALNGRKPQTVSIIIGPEGGFEKEETEFAAECGIKPVTLGKRILRTETAPLAVSAAVLYEFDEME